MKTYSQSFYIYCHRNIILFIIQWDFVLYEILFIILSNCDNYVVI